MSFGEKVGCVKGKRALVIADNAKLGAVLSGFWGCLFFFMIWFVQKRSGRLRKNLFFFNSNFSYQCGGR